LSFSVQEKRARNRRKGRPLSFPLSASFSVPGFNGRPKAERSDLIAEYEEEKKKIQDKRARNRRKGRAPSYSSSMDYSDDSRSNH
jgi:hypothetical protein